MKKRRSAEQIVGLRRLVGLASVPKANSMPPPRVLWRRQGRIPRGGHVLADLSDTFPGGETTLAVRGFPMAQQTPASQVIPTGPALTVWMEGTKLPPLE